MQTKTPLTVGKLRQQSALCDAGSRVLIQIDGVWLEAIDAWPDTALAPAGEGFYIRAGKAVAP
jgi:hypothetical protein